MSTSTVPNATSRIKLKKKMPFIIAVVLILTFLLGFAAPASAAPVCEIVDTDGSTVLQQYTDLADALDDVSDGQTIRLLADIDYNSNILVDGISVTFDVTGYVLNVTSAQGHTLKVEMFGEVNLIGGGTGEFNVICQDLLGNGVFVSNGKATVTSVTSSGFGVYVIGLGSAVTVSGGVMSARSGITTELDSVVSVGGDVLSGGSNSITAGNSSSVTVGGSVTGGISSTYSATVNVGGDVSNSGGSHGVYTDTGATVTVGGNVVGNVTGVRAIGDSFIDVDGDVTGNVVGVQVKDSIVNVGGDVTSNTVGVQADNSTVNVGGDVISDTIGIQADDESEVTVDGVITVPVDTIYIEINGSY